MRSPKLYRHLNECFTANLNDISKNYLDLQLRKTVVGSIDEIFLEWYFQGFVGVFSKDFVSFLWDLCIMATKMGKGVHFSRFVFLYTRTRGQRKKVWKR